MDFPIRSLACISPHSRDMFANQTLADIINFHLSTLLHHPAITKEIFIHQVNMPTAIAKVGDLVLAEANAWETVEGNVYVC